MKCSHAPPCRPTAIEAKDAYFVRVIFSGFVDLYHPLFERARGQGLYSASLFPHAIRPLEVPPPRVLVTYATYIISWATGGGRLTALPLNAT